QGGGGGGQRALRQALGLRPAGRGRGRAQQRQREQRRQRLGGGGQAVVLGGGHEVGEGAHQPGQVGHPAQPLRRAARGRRQRPQPALEQVGAGRLKTGLAGVELSGVEGGMGGDEIAVGAVGEELARPGQRRGQQRPDRDGHA